jgi:superfamily II DNA or RNA helicase
MAALAARSRHRGRCLIVVPRLALIDQTAATLARWAPDLTVGVVQGARDEVDADVVVATVQTITRPGRVQRLGSVGVVMVDEAHHSVSAGHIRLLGDLRVGAPDVPVAVGVTATPGGRSDRQRVLRPDGFDHVAHSVTTVDLIERDYLRDVTCRHVRSRLDYDRLKTSGGDFTDASLDVELARAEVMADAADGWVEHAADRLTIAFTPSVRSGRVLVDELRERGVAADLVTGTTPVQERGRLYAGLATGRIRVLASVGVLTEGFDVPAVSCVLIVRPTRARGIFVQMAGRALRKDATAPGVGSPETALILDLYAPPASGLAGIRALTADPVTGDEGIEVRDGETVAEAVDRDKAEKEKAEREAREQRTRQTREIDLLGSVRVRWKQLTRVPDRIRAWSAPSGPRESVVVVTTGGEQWAVLAVPDGQAPVVLADGVEQGDAQRLSEARARAAGVLSSPTAAWLERPASPAQIRLLGAMGRPVTDGLTAGDATAQITDVFLSRAVVAWSRSMARS